MTHEIYGSQDGVRQGTESLGTTGYDLWTSRLEEQMPGGLPRGVKEALREMLNNGMGPVLIRGFLGGTAEALNPREA